jgi:hypothetical protein
MVILPALQHELDSDRQACNLAWSEALNVAWREVGGRPTPVRGDGPSRGKVQRQSDTVPWAGLQRAGAYLTIEIQNNSPATPAEQQLLLFDTVIWRSIAYLLGDR